MQTLSFKRKALITGLIILAGWFFVTSGFMPGNRLPRTVKLQSFHFNAKSGLNRLVKASEIIAALGKTTSKKVLMDVYPIKMSADNDVNDFKLVILFHDAANPGKILGQGINMKKFKKHARNYVRYLKSLGVAKANIPHGYQLTFTTTFMVNVGGVYINVIPDQSGLEYCSQSAEGLDATPKGKGSISQEDSCPPTCCKNVPPEPLKQDSAGKCPPDCPIIEKLILDIPMAAVVDKVYGVN